MRSLVPLLLSALLPIGLAVGPFTAASGVAAADSSANLAATPPLGWNSWNKFGCNVSESLIKQTADAMVTSGMRDAGYTYVNIDDCWMAPQRDALGRLVPDPVKFPDGIRGTADYVHARGLKLGIYSSAGTNTCAGFPASLDHEQVDAASFADWGVDYLKYDNCNNQNRPALDRYKAMGDALRKSGRPIVYSLCEWGENKPWLGLGRQAGGQLWRTTGDISDNWGSVLSILDQQVGLETYSGPNGWNDPDMLEVGNGGMTDTEYRAHFTLWALLNAPLIAGNDIRTMNAATKDILLNRDLIAVDQDWGGSQGHKISDDGDHQVWAKPMSDGSIAVVLLNRGNTNDVLTSSAHEIGLPAGSSYRVRDLWNEGQQSETTGTIRAEVAPHGAAAYRVWPQHGVALPPLTTFALADPEVVDAGKPLTVNATLFNDGRTPLNQVRAQLQVPAGWTVTGNAVEQTSVVRSGTSWTAQWTLTPQPNQPVAAPVRVSAAASFHTLGGDQSLSSEFAAAVVTSPPPGVNQVSALPFVSEINGWGPVERNMSNGEQARGDGHPITIAGVRYATGLGAHAYSSVRIYLGSSCARFSAKVGVDDETNGNGSVAFHVLGDRKELAATPTIYGHQAAVPLDAPVSGVRMLELRVTDGGDGISYDHADWAAATVTC